jgi:iron complex transport system permease protein
MFLKTVVEARKAQEILIWLMGTLAVEGVDPGLLALSAGGALAGAGWLIAMARPMNALSLGSETAAALGVDVERVRRTLLLAASLTVAAIVPVVGLIGFVGLVVPHALRLSIGADHRLLLPAAAVYGGAFLVACDLVSRLLFPVLSTETPVGVVTAFAGGPLFVWLLRRQGARGEAM